MPGQNAVKLLRQLAILAVILIVNGAVVSAVLYVSTKGSTSTVGGPHGTEGRAYQVTFQQVRDCGQYNILPWAVTLNGLTIVQPSNQTLSLPTDTFSIFASDQNLTRITFSVPPGIYNYAVLGGGSFGGGLTPVSGTVQVNSSDVVVQLGVWLSITC